MILGERPGALVIAGGVVTVVGVMLTSTDLVKLRAGMHGMPPGSRGRLLGGGVRGGWADARAAVAGPRVGARALELALRAARRLRDPRHRSGEAGSSAGGSSSAPRSVAALTVGGTDLLGVFAYSVGAERGAVTPVLIASAIFPLIAVCSRSSSSTSDPWPTSTRGSCSRSPASSWSGWRRSAPRTLVAACATPVLRARRRWQTIPRSRSPRGRSACERPPARRVLSQRLEDLRRQGEEGRRDPRRGPARAPSCCRRRGASPRCGTSRSMSGPARSSW